MDIIILDDDSGTLKFTTTDLVDNSLTFEYPAKQINVDLIVGGKYILKEYLAPITVSVPNITINFDFLPIDFFPDVIYKLNVRRIG